MHRLSFLLTNNDSAAMPTATKPRINKEVPATQTYSSSAYRPMPEQGTTQRNPVNINDDDSNDDDEYAMNEEYDASFNQIATEVMSQKPHEELKTPLIASQILESRSADAHISPVPQAPARLSEGHAGLDILVHERAQRKPNLVSFNDAGPRNQGTRNMKKCASPDMHRLPFTEALSPDLDQSNLEDPPGNYDTSLNMPTKKTPNSEIAGTSAHGGATSPVHKTLGDVYRPKPKPPTGQPCEAASTTDPSTVRDKRPKGSELPIKAVTTDDRHANTRSTRDAADNATFVVNYAATERGVQAESLETLVEDHSRKLSKKPEVLPQSTVRTKSLAALGKPRKSMEFDEPRDPALAGSRRPGPANQTLALPTPIDTQAPLRIQPQPINRQTETEAGTNQMALAQQTQMKVAELHTGVKQTRPIENDRKRPPTEIIGEPAKRPRTDTLNSHMQVARSPAAKDPVSRRLSQVADNGSPMPYGVEIPRETVQSSRIRDEKMSAISIPPPFLAHQPLDDPFTQVKRFIHQEIMRSESPLEEMDALQEELSAQISPAVTHAGFDEDTQATAEDMLISEPQKQLPKGSVPEPQQSSPQKARATQRTLGLMEALRSEVVPQENAQEIDGDGMTNTRVDEGRDEEDPDKTLVNEETDDGDDDDGNDSSSSSGSDDDGDKPKRGLSMWRDGLESHQGNVYDQLVRIAHRLTEHLKDHETAIKDISTDYKQDGVKLITRLEKDNEARLEQYCTKRSKMQGGLVLGYRKVSGSIEKDKKEIKASRERHIKILAKQVDAEGRLEQLLQTYHV